MSNDPAADPRIGTRFGPYELRALLGRGRMGEVYGEYQELVDFGIAHSGYDRALTAFGDAIVCYGYMAPERFYNVPITNRADVYSLACVLHEILTGEPPFAGSRPSAIRGIPVGLDVVSRTWPPPGQSAPSGPYPPPQYVPPPQPWAMLGAGPDAATEVEAVLRDGGNVTTVVQSQRVRPGFTAFGQTVVTLAAEPSDGSFASGVAMLDQLEPWVQSNESLLHSGRCAA